MFENSGNYRLFKLNQWNQDGVDVFLSILPLSTAKALGIIENKHQKALKGGKKKEAHLETLRPKEQHDGEFSAASFYMIYSELNARNANCSKGKSALFRQRSRTEST